MPTPSHGSSAASPEVEFDLLREDFLAKFEEVYVPCANIEIGLVCLFPCLLACLFVQHFRFSPDALWHLLQ